jgi:hypothetical protein
VFSVAVVVTVCAFVGIFCTAGHMSHPVAGGCVGGGGAARQQEQ